MLKKCTLSVILSFFLLLSCGCSANQQEGGVVTVSESAEGNSSEDSLADTVTEERNLIIYESTAEGIDSDREIITKSEIAGSFKASCQEEPDFYVYLGHPRRLEGDWEDGTKWYTSDERIATADKGVITGWMEGTAEIFTLNDDGNRLGEWFVAVTTVNDGKTGDYRDNPNIMNTDENHEMYRGTTVPEIVREQVNTIADFINFMYVNGIRCDYDAPIMYNKNWTWGLPGDTVIINGGGVSCDLANAAAYVLQYDYEDWGFIMVYGQYSHILNYFYEDGIYHLVDFLEAAMEVNEGIAGEASDKIYDFRSIDEIADFVKAKYSSYGTMAIYMVSAMGHNFGPASYMSFMSDSSKIYDHHNVIGVEQCVYDNLITLYVCDHIDFKMIGIPTDEMATWTAPTYDERTVNEMYFYYPYMDNNQ